MSSIRICIYDKLTWMIPWGPLHNIAQPAFKKGTKYPRTCQVGFHVDFSSTANVVGCSPKLPSCKPKARVRGTLNQLRIQEIPKATA